MKQKQNEKGEQKFSENSTEAEAEGERANDAERSLL